MLHNIVFWTLSVSGLLIGLFLASPGNDYGIFFFCLSNLLVLSAFAVAIIARARASLRRNDEAGEADRRQRKS